MKVKPRAMTQRQIHQHPWIEMYLEWVRENYPNIILDVYEEGGAEALRERAVKKVRKALDLKQSMIGKGLMGPEADEVALDTMIPSETWESVEIPRELPDEMFERIVDEVMER